MITKHITFFQGRSLGGEQGIGLIDLFLTNLVSFSAAINPCDKIRVVVPNAALGAWLKDRIADKFGVCANIEFIVLIGPIVEQIYLLNNQQHKLFDFNQIKYLIYDYLLNLPDAEVNKGELYDYISPHDSLDKLRAYQLATQLAQIFQEYIYLRTDELLNLASSNFCNWQKEIWQYLLQVITPHKTFLDIYQFFMQFDYVEQNLILPENLFIFGLTSIYPAQAAILDKLAQQINIFWYYPAVSEQYYGELLSIQTRSKLERKLVRYPDLNFDDLYLIDGNPLVAALAQQSREFTELTRIYDWELYSFNPQLIDDKPSTLSMLQIIQQDIRSLKSRIAPQFRFSQNQEFYAQPIHIQQEQSDKVHDLAEQCLSIKINSCHNRMREVQVMFNELAALLNKNPQISLDQILVTAYNIDEYAPYISAVFDNEVLQNVSGKGQKIPYRLIGSTQNNHKTLQVIKLLINLPIHLPVNYLLEIIMQSEIQENLNLSTTDIDLIKTWLKDNQIYFGFDANDYANVGYKDYSIHSFKQFIYNLVLGGCLKRETLIEQNAIPSYTEQYIPYDNLDNNQLQLVNKLIDLIEQLEIIRRTFYNDNGEFCELGIGDIQHFFKRLISAVFSKEDSLLAAEQFLGALSEVKSQSLLTLPIIDMLLQDCMQKQSVAFRFSGVINCTAMHYMRNIPYQYVYILGLNFGEFPAPHNSNQLSILSREWQIADRNYMAEDRQIFLDLILATGRQLFLSYIGRNENDNSLIEPSPVLNLFINTLANSFSNFWRITEPFEFKFDLMNVFVENPLHPFHNNPLANFSSLHHRLSQSFSENKPCSNWNFAQISPIQLSVTQCQTYYSPKLKDLLNCFLWSNYNLNRVLGISTFDEVLELVEIERLNIRDSQLAKQINNEFAQYYGKISKEMLHEYLSLKGIINDGAIGNAQFDYYYSLYEFYLSTRGNQELEIKLTYSLTRDEQPINLSLVDRVFVENNRVIISEEFSNLRTNKLAKTLTELPLSLKLNGLIVWLILNNTPHFSADGLVVNEVVIRQITINHEVRDFRISVSSVQLLDKIFRYYLRSLTNPVFIHRAAIDRFAEIYRKNSASHESAITSAANAAKILLNQDFQNYELDKLKRDIIFRDIADQYFEFTEQNNLVNDIIQIGSILGQLSG